MLSRVRVRVRRGERDRKFGRRGLEENVTVQTHTDFLGRRLGRGTCTSRETPSTNDPPEILSRKNRVPGV